MPEFPETSASLIASIKDPENSVAWESFEKLYRPVIFRIARAKGLQYADATDLVQQVFVSVASAIDAYQPNEAGAPFRNWLSKITRNAILKALTRQPKDRASGGTAVWDLLSEVPVTDASTSALIENELRQEIFQLAANEVRLAVQPVTWLAFELSVLQHHPIDEVAKKLNLSVGNVYAARSRVMKRLKETVQRFDTESPTSISAEIQSNPSSDHDQ